MQILRNHHPVCEKQIICHHLSSFLPQLLELEHRGGAVSTKDILSVVGDKMSDHFEEFFREHGGQSGGEQKSEQAAKGWRYKIGGVIT